MDRIDLRSYLITELPSSCLLVLSLPLPLSFFFWCLLFNLTAPTISFSKPSAFQQTPLPATHTWAWSWLLSLQPLSVPQCHIPPALSWSTIPHYWRTLSSPELKPSRILAHHHRLQILFLWGAFKKWLWRGGESSCCLIYKPAKIQKDWLSLGKCPEV